MIRLRGAGALAVVVAIGCKADTFNYSAHGASIETVNAVPNMNTSVWVTMQTRGGDSVRVSYASSDGSDTGSTPWFAAGASRIPVLGLLPNTTYLLTPSAWTSGSVVAGNAVTYQTGALPAAFEGGHFYFVAGSAFTKGFNVTAVRPGGADCFLIMLDSVGTIRWYRDMGLGTCYEAKQQTNGDFTVFVADTAANVGAYVELTPEGDSVRSVVARGSPFTDEHELVSTYGRGGILLADYLFGFDQRSLGLEHQIVRVAAGGQVDTLIQGWTQWSPSDQIEPGSGMDLDHPNALGFDVDSGVVVSYRSLSSIVKVGPVAHEVQWILGGTHNQFTILNDPLGSFDGQHDVRILPNGHVMMFDNGWHHMGAGSRAVEYQLDLKQMTATMVWQYDPSPALFVPFTGSAQRLANGNTLVAFTGSNTLDEVTPAGSLIARAQLAGPSAIFYRVTRVASLYSYVAP